MYWSVRPFVFVLFFIYSQAYRLPTDVMPEHYNLQIITSLENEFKFKGNVEIETNCLHPTTNITLHSQNLTISEKDVSVQELTDKKKVPVKKIEYDVENYFLIIQLDEPLEEDHKYAIKISFEGKLDDSLEGFYRSSYTDKKTKSVKWLAVTQFEPTSARKAFPCFDEPSMKSTFEISIGRKEGYTSVSNMPLLTTEPIQGMADWYWDKFENSVPMSTYLVAFMVSDFAYKAAEPFPNSNVTFKIWARKDAIDQVDFACQVGPKALHFYEEFFNIKYPLPKQDMVAIPDFSAGAMENWGLITYRETALLFDNNLSSATSQHRVAEVIAHELAHQWFGNLVTMNWWTDLWLNEGFATYMASLALNHLFPNWNSLQEETVDGILSVFTFDALKSSHPVSVTIGNPHEINEIFDTISYSKGSFLLRMMSLFLGEETLRLGVSHYLEQHKYGNAEQDDLWQALTDEAHKNGVLDKNLTVKTIMDTWTLRTGFPVITVVRNYEKGTAEITQKRFFRDSIMPKDNNPPCWWVPLSYTTRDEKDFNRTMPRAWLSCPNDQPLVISNLPNETDWLIFNIELSGLYKINYDKKNWKLLIDALKSQNNREIPEYNRVQIVDDASDFAWTGLLEYEILFELFQYLANEDAYLPWKASLSNLYILERQLKRSPVYPDFKLFMRSILRPAFQKLNGVKVKQLQPDQLASIKYQVAIISSSCHNDIPECISDAKKQFQTWNTTKNNTISKDLRGVIYCTALKEGGEAEYNLLWEQYKKSNLGEEQDTILRSLSCTKDTSLLKKLLELSITEGSNIRKQDSTSVFASIIAKDEGYFVGKEFLYTNFNKIKEFLGDNHRRVIRYVANLAARITTSKDSEEFQQFVTAHKDILSESKQGLEQALETVKLNLQWQASHLETVEKVLKKLVIN